MEMLLTHHLTEWRCLTNGSSTPTNPCEYTIHDWTLRRHCPTIQLPSPKVVRAMRIASEPH